MNIDNAMKGYDDMLARAVEAHMSGSSQDCECFKNFEKPEIEDYDADDFDSFKKDLDRYDELVAEFGDDYQDECCCDECEGERQLAADEAKADAQYEQMKEDLYFK